ncbi:MAG: hypothetical protein ACJA0T_001724 [Colwellia sp.]|jgi:hypothetical protein
MNKLLISSIITASILLAGNAQASNIDSVTENNLIKVCNAIKSDSLVKVKVAVQESGISIIKIANGLVCNGFDPVSFALANDAEKTAEYMANKISANHQKLVAKL